MGKASRKKRTGDNAISLAKSRHSELPTSTKKGILYNPIFHILLIAIIGFMSYSNTFNVPFHFDDTPVIVENPIIKNLRFFIEPSEAKVYSEHFQYPSFSMRYIGYFTFALNYKVHGLDVTGYHIFNLLIHIINALLLYWLVILTFRTPYFSYQQSAIHQFTDSPIHQMTIHPFTYLPLFVALLFVCHPIQTQAVTYIWQRVTSLATMFYLLSLVMYIKWRFITAQQSNRTAEQQSSSKTTTALLLYCASLISAILAMKTKEISFTLPLIIVLYEFMFFEGKIKKRLLYLIPILLTMLILPLTLIGTDKPIGDLIGDVSEATRVQTTMSRSDYLFTQFRVIVTYIRLLFLPINQNLDYDYPIYDSFLNPNVFLSFLFLLSIFSLGIYFLYRSRITKDDRQQTMDESSIIFRPSSLVLRLISFGIFWFFITLSVESSIIPIVDVIFEHRVYLPSVGVFIAITTSAFILVSKLKRKWPQIEKTVTPVLALIIIILSIAAYARNIVWKDEISLWEDVVRKSPEKARGYYNLGKAYFDKGMTDKAIEYLKISVTLDPINSMVHNNLGIAYRSKGWFDKAMEHFLVAIRLKPDYADAHNNLGIAYRSKGWFDKAMEHFLVAIRLKPDYADAHNNLGNACFRKGLNDKAMEHFLVAIRLKPDYADAHFNLGLVYLEKRIIDKARNEFEVALQINPDDYQARQFLNYISNLDTKHKSKDKTDYLEQ